MEIPILPAEYKSKFDSFPEHIQQTHQYFRLTCYKVAHDLGYKLTESVKWGQLSITTKGGTPVRIDWQEKQSDVFSVFCHCQTKLIETFRQLYPSLTFIKTREWQISRYDEFPSDVVIHLVQTAFQYQKLKHEPLLGQSPRV